MAYRVLVSDSDDEEICAVDGRPYRDGSVALRAPVRSSSPAVASRRAAAWERAGADEHASVAAFARLSLQLMAHGAPADLLRDVHQAALDEVGHAERCWSVARRLGAASVGAAPFPFTSPVATCTPPRKDETNGVIVNFTALVMLSYTVTFEAMPAPVPTAYTPMLRLDSENDAGPGTPIVDAVTL